jgi:hypothetical protein
MALGAGARYVVTDPAALVAASTATLPDGQIVSAILQPAGRAGVQERVPIAHLHCVPLYPISGGKNWGYGSRVPPHADAVILDLGQPRRITEFEMSWSAAEPALQKLPMMLVSGLEPVSSITNRPHAGSRTVAAARREDPVNSRCRTGKLFDRPCAKDSAHV